MGSRKTVTTGYKYYLGLLLGWCHGVPDALLRLRADDRDLWNGRATAESALTVDKEGLFGGDSREGGMAGTVRYMPGLPTQNPSAYLLSALSSEVPAHRGVVTTVFQQFYIGTSTYLKKLSAKMQRIYLTDEGEDQWYPAKAGIESTNLILVEPWVGGASPLNPANAHQFRNNTGGTTGPWRATVEEALADAGLVGGGLLGWSADGIAMGSGTPEADAATVFLHYNPQTPTEYSGTSIAFDTVCFIGLTPDDTYGLWAFVSSYGRTGIVHLRNSGGEISTPGEVLLNNCVNYPPVEGYFPPASVMLDTLIEVRRGDGSGGGPILDMNAAHIIRESLTNPEWGMGQPEADMGDSFTTCADQLYSEGFGLSFVWDRQQPIESFIDEVRRHIDAALYIEPTTGKYEMKLIRDDYDVEDLEVFDESNIDEVLDYTRRQPDELVNSVTVKYEDNGTDRPATVEVQDIAQILMQGAVVPTTVSYPGVGNAKLASRIAARELKGLSSPLISCKIKVSGTSGRALRIGQPIVFSWPDYGVESVVMRVAGLSHGDGVRNGTTVAIVQDVYALPSINYTTIVSGEWTDVSAAPTPVAHQIAFETPYYSLVRELGESAVAALLVDDPDVGLVSAAALRPTGAINFIHATDAGDGYEELAVPGLFSPCCTIDADIDRSDTTIDITPEDGFSTLVAGDYGSLGDEIIEVVSITDTTMTVNRGMLDTTPTEHLAGARFFAWSRGSSSDSNEFTAGEEPAVKLLPVTGRGTLAIGAATPMTITMAARAVRPYAPGNVEVNGDPAPSNVVAEVLLTWAHRDRTLQTGSTLVTQTDGDIGPEAGVTYNVHIYDNDTDELLEAASGISGTSYAVDPVSLSESSNIRVELWSTRGSSTQLALAAAFEVLSGDPMVVYRFLPTAGGRIDIVYNTTMFGNFYTANRYSAAGVLQDALTCRQVSCASFDAANDLLVIGTYTLPLTDPAELWFIDTSGSDLNLVAAVEPDFPTPSGAERIYAAAGGGNVIAINYDHSRIIKYAADGTETLQVDEALDTRLMDYDGTNLVFGIAGGVARYNPSDLTFIADTTYSPAVDELTAPKLVNGEVVVIGDPTTGILSTLYRHNLTTGARIASYANIPLSANGSPPLSFFSPYLAAGDDGDTNVVFDTTDWDIVTTAGSALSQDSWQRQILRFSFTETDALLIETGDTLSTEDGDSFTKE